MRIEVIAPAYNEEKLMPLFLKHYDFADRITIFLEGNDRTAELCLANPKVNIIRVHSPDGINDTVTVDILSEYYRTLKEGWVMCLDIDEFYFAADMRSIPWTLEHENECDGLHVRFFQMYRHWSEGPINYDDPPLAQRRHGDDRYPSAGGKFSVLRAGLDVRWAEGYHALRGNPELSIRNDTIFCAHWQMADADIAIQRRIKNSRNRMSLHNMRKGYGNHNYSITEDAIRAACANNQECKKLF